MSQGIIVEAPRASRSSVALLALSCAAIASIAHAQISVVRTTPRRPDSGLVNAPVAPEAIYIGMRGGVSVVDLNGFGQGTGSLAKLQDPNHPFGFKRNPNLGRPGVFPPLTPGSSNADAGSLGALTLTLDSFGKTRLLTVNRVDDMQLGQPLDLVYNNENINRSVTFRNQINPATRLGTRGNTIAVAPHPNPPRLVFPSPNPRFGIDCEEPTVATSLSRVCYSSPGNMLVPGNPFSLVNPGLFAANFPGLFYGPQPPTNAPVPFCPYTSRQQVGHFLYVLDSSARQVLVVNSNRFTVLARIPLPSPTSMAMAPSLKLLAVSNAAQGSVSFIDTDPMSPTFHRVLASVAIGRGASGLAWQPEGESLLVCNGVASSLTLISGLTFRVRKILRNSLKNPVDVAVSARQFGFGVKTSTWFAYILNGDGTLSIYESGPTPIGPDAVRATGLRFPGARAIQPGPSVWPECWITHRDPLGLGQVSRVALSVSPNGTRTSKVAMRIGGTNATTFVKDLFSGNEVVDLAFDEIRNYGAHPEVRSAAIPNLPVALHSGKGVARRVERSVAPSYDPFFLFVACADTGKVDIMQISTGHKLRALDAPGVMSLAHYWRQ